MSWKNCSIIAIWGSISPTWMHPPNHAKGQTPLRAPLRTVAHYLQQSIYFHSTGRDTWIKCWISPDLTILHNVVTKALGWCPIGHLIVGRNMGHAMKCQDTSKKCLAIYGHVYKNRNIRNIFWKILALILTFFEVTLSFFYPQSVHQNLFWDHRFSSNSHCF